ncbi:MAG: N-(5'-phosphoribosyl)anthranilate isomerase [Burkholderiales bacterium RIFCSPLOWO2_02_FULL_57_36]|nr:MAG: N-(5'-phosphoribosyl)anthranilate isomerase [Burkholderiales bacterium RIFCSPLOWO2_02_FULL_57_36]
MTHRTRIKLCGMTRADDVQAAVAAGADALGFVFYPGSPRYVAPDLASRLLSCVPGFVTTVGLFVNASSAQVIDTVARAPVSLLQFHGDETLELCCETARAVNRPFLRVIRVKPDMQAADLLKYEHDSRAASDLFSGLLLDTWVDEFGGSGKVFDWSLIPEELAPRVVLSGGLSVQNATDAVARVRPFAVDVSSGIEFAKGVKDSARMRAFVDAVRSADAITR